MAAVRVAATATSVATVQCRRWDDFIQELRITEGRPLGRRIFRGQRSPEWPLSSPFERSIAHMKGTNPRRDLGPLFEKGALERLRQRSLLSFKKRATGLLNIDVQNRDDDNEWWALGRHHGLITPLLDWSESPFVAAFFALIDHIENNNAGFRRGHIQRERTFSGGLQPGSGWLSVWSLTLTDELCRRSPSDDRGGQGLQIIENVPAFSGRQKAQQGLFTFLTHDIHIDLCSYLRARNHVHLLERYDICANECITAIRDLRRMNIRYATLFPDADGAAWDANTEPWLCD